MPKLNPEDRSQVFQRLCELQDDDLLHGAGPSIEEKEMPDAALTQFERDGTIGTPWREAIRRLQSKSGQ